MNQFTVPLRFGGDLPGWATEYDIPPAEAEADVRQALTRAVEDGWLVQLIADAWPMMRDHIISAGPVEASVSPADAGGRRPRRPSAPRTAGSCPHRRVQVPHTAPIEVVVDTGSGAVNRVVVIDEAVSADPQPTYHCNDCAAVLAADSPAARAARAITAADHVEWPAWDHGW